MNTTELLAQFRTEVVDIELPYLWSDALIYTYIDEAQKQFCRLTEGIEDSRSFALKIKVGTSWYSLDPSILKIRSAHDSVTGREIPIIASEKMSNMGLWFDGATGPIKALIAGLEKGALRALPIPSIASTVELRTFRLPQDLVSGGVPIPGNDFEIDEQHRLNLLYWVKYRAYSVQDADAGDKGRADLNRKEFEMYCARARAEQERVRRPVSTVAYGGI